MSECHAALQAGLREMAADLAQQLSRGSRPSEPAGRLGVAIEEVFEVLQMNPALWLVTSGAMSDRRPPSDAGSAGPRRSSADTSASTTRPDWLDG